MDQQLKSTDKEKSTIDIPAENELSIFPTQQQGVTIAADLFSSDKSAVNFRGVSWQAAAVLIAKLQIGLGALSLPSTFHTLGFVPGILCFLVVSLISSIAGYLCGNARQYYPHLHSAADAAELLFGKGAREFVGIIYYLYLAMTAGAGMLTTSVALNALTNHGACTTAYVGVACGLAFIIGTGFRGLDKVAWISWVGVAAIFIAIWTTAIACLAQSRPAAAPSVGALDLDIRAFPDTTFQKAMTAVANQLFAVGASGAFFSVSAEMQHPQMFTRSLVCGQGFIVLTCLAIASIVYGKIGQYLASPALGSAGLLIKKVSYGVALPGLLATAVLYSHISAKYCFVRVLRGTRHLQQNTLQHWIVWVGSMMFTVALGFVIVGVVPFFGDFLSLVGALINPVFTNILPGFMLIFYTVKRPGMVVEGAVAPIMEIDSGPHWLVESFTVYKKGRKGAALIWVAYFMIVSGIFIIVGGSYATIASIRQAYSETELDSAFSCADNSS